MLLLGGLAVAAFPALGLTASVGGYVHFGNFNFGYAPANCGVASTKEQALNGDVVHVCQADQGKAGAFFASQERWPLIGSSARLTLLLPDPKLAFSCCELGSNGTGTYLKFTPSVFGPVSGTNPISGTSTYSAKSGLLNYADISQTAELAPGEAGYTMKYAITNTSGAPLRLRPMVQVLPPTDSTNIAFATGAGPFRVTLTDQDAGASVKLTSSTVGGSPDISGYSAGDDLGTGDEPGGALDGVIHPPPYSMYPDMAVDWSDHASAALAAGATAHYSLRVDLTKPRALRLALHDPSYIPTPDTPTVIDATADDDRPLAGHIVRWSVQHGTPSSGTATLGSDGKTSFAIPAHRGVNSAIAYLDYNGNGSRDANEQQSTWITVWAPGTVSVTPASPSATTPSPAVTGPPAPSPAVTGPPAPSPTPGLTLNTRKNVKYGAYKKGLKVTATVATAAKVKFSLTIPSRVAVKLRITKKRRSTATVLAKGGTNRASAGQATATLNLSKRLLKRLRRHRTTATLTAVATSPAGVSSTASTSIVLSG